MASIDFYALKDDIRQLVYFIFEETDLRVFESYSEYDKELREFRSFDDLSGAFELGRDKHGHGFAVLLQLWSSTVIPNVGFERTRSLERTRAGHVGSQCGRLGPPASLSSVVGRIESPTHDNRHSNENIVSSFRDRRTDRVRQSCIGSAHRRATILGAVRHHSQCLVSSLLRWIPALVHDASALLRHILNLH